MTNTMQRLPDILTETEARWTVEPRSGGTIQVSLDRATGLYTAVDLVYSMEKEDWVGSNRYTHNGALKVAKEFGLVVPPAGKGTEL